MAINHEQLTLEGFDDSMPPNQSIHNQPNRSNIQESKLMLTAVARQRLNLIIRGDINDSEQLDVSQKTLPNT